MMSKVLQIYNLQEQLSGVSYIEVSKENVLIDPFNVIAKNYRRAIKNIYRRLE